MNFIIHLTVANRFLRDCLFEVFASLGPLTGLYGNNPHVRRSLPGSPSGQFSCTYKAEYRIAIRMLLYAGFISCSLFQSELFKAGDRSPRQNLEHTKLSGRNFRVMSWLLQLLENECITIYVEPLDVMPPMQYFINKRNFYTECPRSRKFKQSAWKLYNKYFCFFIDKKKQEFVGEKANAVSPGKTRPKKRKVPLAERLFLFVNPLFLCPVRTCCLICRLQVRFSG